MTPSARTGKTEWECGSCGAIIDAEVVDVGDDYHDPDEDCRAIRPWRGEITEELVSTIRERVRDTLDSDVATACLMALADRGVFTYRELPRVARELDERIDLTEPIGMTIDYFARAVGLGEEEVR